MKTQIQRTELYIRYKHLCLYPSKNNVIFLGYNINATKTEYAILQALIENASAPLSSEQISNITSLNMSKNNLAFHISNINSKAKMIGNRPLIKNIVKIGYFLNEEM